MMRFLEASNFGSSTVVAHQLVDRADHDPHAHRYRSRVALLELPYERAGIEDDAYSGENDVRQLRRHRGSALTASLERSTR